jgi:hypothetical protein
MSVAGPPPPTCALHKVGRLAGVLRTCPSCYRHSENGPPCTPTRLYNNRSHRGTGRARQQRLTARLRSRALKGYDAEYLGYGITTSAPPGAMSVTLTSAEKQARYRERHLAPCARSRFLVFLCTPKGRDRSVCTEKRLDAFRNSPMIRVRVRRSATTLSH